MYHATICGRVIGLRGKTLKTWDTHDGYKQFGMYATQGAKKNKQVGKFVYEYFYGPVEDGYVVDHINSDRSDNRLNNLQKITYSENTQRGLLGKLKGGDKEEIKRLYQQGWLQKDIGKKFGISQGRVSNILKVFTEEGV